MKVYKSKYIWLVLFVLFLGVGFILRRNTISPFSERLFSHTPAPESETTGDSASNVLGSSSAAPRIVVSGGREGYSAGGLIALASSDEPAVTIGTYDNSQGEADIAVYQASEEALVAYLLHDKDGMQTQKTPDVSQFQYVTSVKTRVQPSGDDSRVVLPLGETGIWCLAISYAGSTEYAFIIRSHTGVIVKEGNSEFIFWGQDFRTRRSISQGTLRLYSLLDERKDLGEATFGSDGVAKAALLPEADIAIAKVESDIAIIPINLQYLNYRYTYRQFQNKMKSTRFFIFTDRPIYKQGDTVYFKSVLRGDDDARYTIPQGTARVLAYKDWDEKNTIFEKSIEISADGTVYGDFTLPEGEATGYYQLKIVMPETTQEDYRYDESVSWWTNTIGFQVEHFRKPEYSIDLSSPRQEYIMGDTLPFTVSGNYFSGQPLSAQTVKYTILSGDFYEYEYRSEQPVDLSDEYRYGWWGGKTVATGTAVFDGRGEALVEVPLAGDFVSTKTKVLSIEAEFDDGSGNPSFARKNVLLYPGQFGIFREDRSGWSVKLGKEVAIGVTLLPRVETSISRIKLTGKIHRENWVSYQEEGKKYPSYRKDEEDLPAVSATTDGNGKATLRFTPPKVGSYTLTASAKDAKGNTIEKAFYAWVTDQDIPVYNGGYEQPMVIRASQDKYNPGDTARFNVYSTTPDRDIFFSLDRARAERYQIVHLSGTSIDIEIPLEASDMPNIYASAMSFSSSTLDRASVNVPVSAESKRLAVTLEPSDTTFAPGETVRVTVTTKDTNGNGVSSDIALWAVDKALFELVDERPQKIFDRFWSERTDGTRDSHSLAGITVLTAEGGGCFARGTPVLLADGTTKPIEGVKVGDAILTRKSENDQTLVKAKVTGVHHTVEPGYLIVNGHLNVTANHILWVNGTWKEAGSIQVGDLLIGSSGEEVAVTSVEWQSGVVDVYNLSIEGNHTYFAGGVWVHNQKGGGNARTVFKDTAYWNPTVRTDGDGKATVSFTLPDNLTTWVIAAVGDTADTKVGQATAEIVVTKSVVVRPVVPNLLRVGDAVTLTSLIHNYTDSEETFDVSLELAGAEVTPKTHENVAISSKSMKELSWDVVPKVVDEQAKLTVSAASVRDKNLGDTISQVLPVQAFGFIEQRGHSGDGPTTYPMTLAPDSDPEKSTITLSLSPTMLGSLPSAMRYLVDYPYGCVEQTTSRFVPAVIAKANPELFAGVLGDKDIDDIIAKGVKRLASMQQTDGGWAWWSSGRSDPYVTAYVIEYLLLSKANGSHVSDEVLAKVKTYFENTIRYTPDHQLKTLTPEENVLVGYATMLLDPTKTTTNYTYQKTDRVAIRPDILAFAVLINAHNGDINPETNGLSVLLSLAKTQGDEEYWEAGDKKNFGSQEASTALAIRAILAGGGNREMAVKAAQFLLRSRRFDYWSNTFSTSQVVRAITELVKTGDELSPSYSYKVFLDGETVGSGFVSDEEKNIKDISIPAARIRKDGSELSITKEGDGQLYSTLIVKEFRTDKKAKAVTNGLAVSREFVNEKGEAYTLGVGDTVMVKLTVSGLASPEYYGVIDDNLASGLIPINERLKNEQFNLSDSTDPGSYDVTDREVTENGMVLSLYQIGSGTRVYSYKARAIAAGEFLVPPARASLMYHPEINGRTGAEVLTIAKASEETPGKLLVKNAKSASDLLRQYGVPVLIGFVGVAILLFSFMKLKSLLAPRFKKSQDLPDEMNKEPDGESVEKPPESSHIS